MIEQKGITRRNLILASLLAVASEGALSSGRPAVLKGLEEQGLTIVDEFQAGGSMRGFAASAGGRPVGVYVTGDGNAIVGTRVGPNGDQLDEGTLERLVAAPRAKDTWDKLQSSKWILDGQANAPRIVYVFTDPNCPYCHRFWEAVRPWVNAGRVQVRHIMVGIIKDDSAAKAAAILGAANPGLALQENERKQGKIVPARTIPAPIQQSLDKNYALMAANGFSGTPGIVIRDATGAIRKINGLPQKETLIGLLGPV